MKTIIQIWVILGAYLLSLPASADEGSDLQPTAYPGVPLADILDSVSKQSGRVFLTSPHVPAEVVVGQLSAKELSYETLLIVLFNNELAAVTVGDVTNIIEAQGIRRNVLPIIYEDDESIAEFEWVNRVVEIHNGHAPQLVPLLRALLPQMAFLVADANSNTLLITGRYGNTKRLVAMIKAMDARSVKQD